MGTPPPSEPEVLGQGREPEPDRLPVRGRRVRTVPGGWTVALVVALVVGGVWYAGRPDLDGSVALPSSSATGTGPQDATPDATTLVSGLAEGHDLTAPAAPALDSFIASGGHVLLFLQVRNVGTATLRITDGIVPQDGASRDLTAGGLAAGTSGGGPLRPGDQTEVFVRLTVRCPAALAGPPAASILLVAEEVGRHPRLERVVTSALGGFWDEARHAACRSADIHRDVTADLVQGSVRAAVTDSGRLSVSAVVTFHDSAGYAAVVTGPAVASGGGGRLVVDGGSTNAVPLRWDGGTCAAPTAPVTAARAPAYRVDLPQETAQALVVLGPGFAADWTAQVQAACRLAGSA